MTRSWSCPECPQAFISVSRWQSHIQEKHRLLFSGHTFNIATDVAYRSEMTRIENDECPLCRTVVGKPRRGFVKHVGRHMEEIALMALPRNVDEDSGEGSLSTDRISLEEGRTSFYAPRSDLPPFPPPLVHFIDDNTSGSDPGSEWGGSPPFVACKHCNQTFLDNDELKCVPPRKPLPTATSHVFADSITPLALTIKCTSVGQWRVPAAECER